MSNHRFQNGKKYPKLPLIAFAAALLLLLAALRYSAVAAQEPTTAEQEVARAWELAQSSGRYGFRTIVEQTTYPQPRITNGGAQPRVQNLGIEGQVDLTAEQINMTLWGDLSFNPDTGVTVKVEDGLAYARRGQGEWQEVDGLTNLFAPNGDPMGFLAGVKNVTAGESRTLDLGQTTVTGSQYLLELDGPVFAEYLRAQLERQLQERGKLPPGLRISSSDAYYSMIGTGELWINEDGLPMQLRLDVDFPARGEDNERVTAVITNNFFSYDLTRLGLQTTPFLQSPGGWLAVHLPPQKALPVFAFGLFLISAAILTKNYYRTKNFYRFIAIFITLSMLFSPLLQSEHVSAFFDEQKQREEAAQERQDESEAIAAGQEAHQATDWKANQDAVTQLQADIPPQLERVTGPDNDNDGITDDEEISYWETDPNNSDTDGDGLIDGQEAYTIGTAPAVKDTDGDKISDGLEVGGFSHASEDWYLNPLQSDTNKDSLNDGLECDVWLESSSIYNPNAACPDTDDDGTPDIFDPDNDNDGVTDKMDLSPITHGNQVFSVDNHFEYKLENLQTGRPVYVDLQFRPINPDHLSHSGSVLDWPTGDKDGQITRYLDTTWADTANLELRSTAENAGNGDIRVLPMLEMVIPGTAGHYGNLPVNSTYSGQERPVGLPVTEWVDTGKLDPYGIGVSDTGDPNKVYRDLLLYVPVSVVTDPDTGMKVAFKSRMPYFPEQGTEEDPSVVDWGSAHSLRLIWVVQMLSDECVNEGANPATCTRQDVMRVVHIYDDQWTLTGMSVSEEHGADLAMIYEDPALDTDLKLDDQLWVTAWNLNGSFIRGRDYDQNGVRDVRVDNLADLIPEWHNPASGPLSLQVETIIGEFEHTDELHRVMMTDTVTLLTSAFAGYESETTPSILFAKENTNRVMTLEVISQSGNTFTADFDPQEVAAATTADISWKPYEYISGEWVNADPSAYLESLDYFLSQNVFVETAEMNQTEIEAAEGQRVWAQMYYAVLYQGIANIVAANGVAVWSTSIEVDEEFYAPSWPASTFRGAAYISTFFFQAFADAVTKTIFPPPGSTLTFWQYFKIGFRDSINAVFSDNFAGNTNTPFFNACVDILLVCITIVAVIGLYILAEGFITGNEKKVHTGLVILNVVSLIVNTAHMIIVLAALIVYLAILSSGILVAATMLNRLKDFLKGSRAFGWIGFVTSVVIAWGMFLYQWLGIGFDGSAIARNTAIAAAIASTTVALVFLLVDVIIAAAGAIAGAVGTVLLLLLFIVDAILFLIGEKTITERFTELIADSLYDVDFVLANFNSAERLSFNIDGITLVDDALGITSKNAFYATISITNTITHRKQSNNGEARRSTFAYFIQDVEKDRHYGLSGNSMNQKWLPIPNTRNLQFTTTITAATPISFGNPGLNRPITDFYLTEAYAIPYAGCWSVFGVETNTCNWEYIKGSSHINVGPELRFDVLPGSITQFMFINHWTTNSVEEPSNESVSVPVQKDLDNDSLLNNEVGGPDPNDGKADVDNDDVSDLKEITLGTDPWVDDTDGDGLKDAEEIVWKTDPNDFDTDDDGLGDQVEVITGWLVRTGNGDEVMRIWSNPFVSDIDGDHLTDLQEFILGQHPGVPTDPSIIANLIEIERLQINETETEPVMWLQFGESYPATTFTDSAAGQRLVTCDNAAGKCPVAGQPGRYNRGLHFDGVNDALTTDVVIDPAQGDFTAALWFRLDDTSFRFKDLLFQDAGSGGPTTYKPWLGITSSRFLYSGLPGPQLSGGPQIQAGRWYYAVFVRDGATNRLFLDGVEVASSTFTPVSSDGQMRIGNVHNDNFAFGGAIDEVVIYDYALDNIEIAELMAGRHNPSDLVLRPGDDFTYQATLTNTLPAQAANGFMVAATEPISPAIPTPEIVLHFEKANERIQDFIPETGNSTTWSCLDNGSCPNISTGKYASAINFDGVNDTVILPTMNVREEAGITALWDYFTLSFWLKVNELPPPGEVAYIMDTTADLPGALDIYLTHDGWLMFDIKDTLMINHTTLTSVYGNGVEIHNFYEDHIGQHVAHGMPTYDDGQRLGQWVHYAFIYSQGTNVTKNQSYIYADYGLFEPYEQLSNLTYEYYGQEYDGLRVGPGTIGNSDAGLPFKGQLDDIAVYNGYSLFHGDETAILDLYLGNYFTQGVEPSFLLPFHHNSLNVNYIDDVTGFTRGLCDTRFSCPTVFDPGANGTALTFDAVDDSMWLGPMAFTEGDYTISGWFRTHHLGAQPILAGLDSTHALSHIRLGLTADGAVEFTHDLGGSVTLSGGSGLDNNTWHHFAAIRSGDESLFYLDGLLVDSEVGGGPEPMATTIRLGGWDTGTSQMYLGRLDEFIVIPAALDEQGVLSLMNSRWPLIDVSADFVPFTLPPVSSLVISDTAVVDDMAESSHHSFFQEVETAIEFPTPIEIPIVDNHAGNVLIYAPFEEVPGAAFFENIAGPSEFICPIPDACPTAGLRGISSRAALFDGQDDYLINASGEMLSFATWVKADEGVIFDTRKNYPFSGIELDFGQLRVQSGGNGNNPALNSYTVPVDLATGKWTHVVVTIDKSINQVSLYINGSPAGSTIYLDTDPYTGRPTLGGNPKGGNYLNGYLDDFRAYNITLTPAAVQALYETSVPALVFEFDEDSSATAYSDNSANGYTGYPTANTYFNPTLGQTVTAYSPMPGTDGQIGNTALFDGSGRIEIPSAPAIDALTNNLTIMAWINPDSTDAIQSILSHGRQHSNNGISFGIKDGSLLYTNWGVSTYASSAEVQPNLWQHVAVVVDDSNDAHFYVNGLLLDTVPGGSPANANSDDPLFIGGTTGINTASFIEMFRGQVDELAVYSRTLSAAELLSIYLREVRWYRAQATSFLVVDSDNPTVELLTTEPYRKPGYTQLVVAANDPTTYVNLLDVGIRTAGETNFE